MSARSNWATVRSERGRARRLGKVLALLRPYRGRVILMLITLVVAVAAALAPAYLAGRAIDAGIRDKDTTALTWIMIAFLGAAIVNFGATYAQTYLTSWVGQRALQDLRRQIFQHLQKLSIGFYSRNKSGVLISRMTNDVQALDQLVTDGIVTLFSASLTLLGTAAILLALDVKLALITFAVFPVLGIASFAFRIASADAYRATREKIASITSYLQETLSGVRIVRAFGQEPRHERQFTGLNDENRDANMKTVYLNAAYFPSVELLSAVATAVILVFGGNEVIDGAVSIGVLASFVFYLSTFFDPIQQLSQLYTTYQSGMAALDKIFGLLDEEPELEDAPDADRAAAGPGRDRLRGRGLHLRRRRRRAARDRPARAAGPDRGAGGRDRRGQVHAGQARGALLRPHRRADHDRRPRPARGDRATRCAPSWAPCRRRASCSRARSATTSPSARPDATDEDVEAAARAVGATEFIEKLPDGYDTEVGERGGHLSAGQRQLVAFARAAAADPRVLILDEATSNVDVATEARIEHGLRRLLAGRTAIVIAHRLSTIQDAGRIVVLEHGRIAEQGTHEELLAAGGAYAALYEDWARQTAA